MIEKRFYDLYCENPAYVYVLHGDGVEVGVCDFAASIQFIRLHTADGVKDICLEYESLSERVNSGTYCGATVGRVANRIRNSSFSLNGKHYTITRNDGKNCNHGGIDGFDRRFFKGEIKGDKLIMTLISPDGDQGFPGNLTLKVIFELVGKSLKITYVAKSDTDTPFAPTAHPYFNLAGAGSGDILDTVLKINADKMTPVDGEHIPTGEVVPVKGTSFDFTAPRPIGLYLKDGEGYDCNFVLNGSHAATAYSAKSGIQVDIFTDLPGVQLYTGKYLNGRGKGYEIAASSGFCLEPQFFPNAVNVPQFVSPVIKAGSEVEHFIKYNFAFEQRR